MKKLSFIPFLFLGFITYLKAQYITQKNGFQISQNGFTSKVTFLTDNIIHIVKFPQKENYNKKSLSVIIQPDETLNLQSEQKAGIYTLKSKNSIVKYNSNLQSFEYTYNGNSKIKEIDHGLKLENTDDDNTASYKVSQSFEITPQEAIYGLGQHQNGITNMRNQTIYMQQKNMDIGIPVIQSTRNYLIFWDNYSATTYKDTLNQISFSSDFGKAVDYYIILGDNPSKIMENYGTLTGKSPMLPLWSFGYIQSRERYKSPEELLDVVRTYRKLNVPLDGIVQDWQYWGSDNNNWNAVAFTNPNYKNVKRYIDSIHTYNAKVMISVWPSFGGQSEIYKEMEKNNYLYDFFTYPVQKNVKVYDAFNPKARDIYWKYMYKNIFTAGIDAWWLDAVEPVQKNIVSGDPNKAGQELFYKDKTTNSKNIKTYLGSFQANGNAYPLATVQGVYENQRKAEQNKRILILTRSGFAGQQRNAAVLWSGDITGSWDVLKAQIPAAINMSYSGIPFWNSDIGGFYSNKNYPKGLEDKKYHELYIRWFQFAVFTAMLRAHGTNIPREIYQFGKPGDITFDIIHNYIDLRYKLLPYIYSNTWLTMKKSSPLIRGLAMNYVSDTSVYNITNEFLFGNNILVSPVTEPIYTNNNPILSNTEKMAHTTYLPKGNAWYNYWTDKKSEGGTNVTQQTDIKTIPLFVKAGSIIPEAAVHPYTNTKFFDTLTIKVYAGENGNFTLYEDEGDNYNYENTQFSTIEFSYIEKSKTLRIGKRNGNYKNMTENRVFNISYYNGTKKMEKTIHYNGNISRILFKS